jgi:cob(I)alamin adenosyltransferase
VQVYTGDGKGKTTAALGVVLRALGHGFRVCIIYFMKGEYPYGEQAALSQLPNISISRFGFLEFCDPNNVREEEKERAKLALETGRQAMLSGEYDVVVMDEVNVAAAWKLIDIADVVSLVKARPQKVELILTGRGADPQIIELADLVTEMVKVKHPYDKGVLSRAGIDC